MFSRLLPACVAIALAATAVQCAAQTVNTFGIVQVQNGRGRGLVRDGHDRGFREGLRQGELDARRGLAADVARDRIYRDGTLGYERRLGERDFYREDFRRGYVEGYRQSYARAGANQRSRQVQRNGQQRSDGVGYQEPAYARGYSDGYRQGQDDGRDRDRYDPVAQRDYRDGDQGYYGSYGPRDAYKNNYRAGYREGYEAGYRGATGRR